MDRIEAATILTKALLEKGTYPAGATVEVIGKAMAEAFTTIYTGIANAESSNPNR